MRIVPDVLAQHLEVAAAEYERDAAQHRRRPEGNRLPVELEALAAQSERQAAQARAWAQDLRSARGLRAAEPHVVEVIG